MPMSFFKKEFDRIESKANGLGIKTTLTKDDDYKPIKTRLQQVRPPMDFLDD